MELKIVANTVPEIPVVKQEQKLPPKNLLLDDKLYFLEASKSEYTLKILCANINEINARLAFNFLIKFGRNTLKFDSFADHRYRLQVIYKQALQASQANLEV